MPSPPLNKKLGDSAQLLKECESVEEELALLRAAYEQYFLGIERRQPDAKHRELRNRINGLRTSFIKSTAVRFRIQSLWTKYLSFDRLWQRTLREMEQGIYRRDLYRAKRKNATAKAPSKEKAPDAAAAATAEPLDELDIDEALAEVSQVVSASVSGKEPGQSALGAALSAAATQKRSPVAGSHSFRPGAPEGASKTPAGAGAPSIAAAPPVRPVAAAGAPGRPASSTPAPVVAQPGGLSEDKVRAIYNAYVSAKKKCNEDVSRLSYESVAQNLRKQMPELMKKHNAQAVEFKIVIKDGKAQLRAVPKGAA